MNGLRYAAGVAAMLVIVAVIVGCVIAALTGAGLDTRP